jgi:hypothetical protein
MGNASSGSLRLIQAWLGPSSPAATSIHTHLTEKTKAMALKSENHQTLT